MFRRFWSTKWVYGNRRHWCSFKATINWLIWNDVELEGLQNCYLGFARFRKFWKIPKKGPFFYFRDSFPPPPNPNFHKTVTYEGWLKSFEPHTENEEIGRWNFVCIICGMFAHVLHSHLTGSTFYYIFTCSLTWHVLCFRENRENPVSNSF